MSLDLVKAIKAPFSGQDWIKKLFIGGILCGVFLCAASVLQQAGIETTTPGKAGFITALYVVLVPVFGIFLRKKTSKQRRRGNFSLYHPC